MELYPAGDGETRARWTQQGLTLGCQLLLSHCYDGGEDAHSRSRFYERIPLRLSDAWLQLAARSWTARILDWKKLHRLIGPTPLGVSAPTGRSRDVDTEVGGQRTVDTEAEGQKLTDAKAEGQRSEGQRDLESESGDPRLVRSGPELEDKYMRKSPSTFDSF